MWQYLASFPELYVCAGFLVTWLLVVLLVVWLQPSDQDHSHLPFEDWSKNWGGTTHFSPVPRDFHQYHMEEIYAACSEDYAAKFARASDQIHL